MIYRFSILILGALLTLFSFNLTAQGFSVSIDSVEVQVGQDVCVPVRAKGFIDIVSFQFSLTWNSQVLKFKKTQNYGLPGLTALDINGTYSNNHLFVGWANPSGECFSIEDGKILFEACFSAVGSVGSSTNITAGSTGFPPGNGGAEAYNCFSQNVWFPAGNDTGFVKIVAFSGTSHLFQKEASAFQVSPNPTQSSAQVIFTSTESGNDLLLVTDALGRIVFEQKIPVNIGENRFEIPDNAMNAKGMYQVSLQTKKGVSCQMLSVQ
ncbi:MAG: T9SS type A sorting domain-containing protein [Phycisphaerae bacterium]|nr:T9SS type A sorting domain-containing protein [Saprospiraceae bacterium]